MYIKNCFLTIVGISLVFMVACSEEKRLPTEEELVVAKAWLTCTKQEKWDETYNQIGTLGTRLAIRNECGAEPPYVPDE